MEPQRPTTAPMAQGLRKAAVLLASLPPADAAYLLGGLDEEQLQAIARVASENGPQAIEQHDVLRELRSVSGACAPDPHDRGRLSREGSTHHTAGDHFADLANASAPLLARLLEAEIPQTVALVLAHLSTKQAAEIIERLPTEKQLAAALRIAEFKTPDASTLADVAEVLVQRTRRLAAAPTGPIGGAGHLARIIQQTSAATQKALLANVSQENRSLVDQIDRHLAILRQPRQRRAA